MTGNISSDAHENGAPGRLSLRRFMGRWVFGLYAAWGLAFGVFGFLSARRQSQLQLRSEEQVEQQALGSRIIGTSTKQLLLAREQVSTSDPAALHEFRELGDSLYMDLIAYSMQPLTVTERYAVRRIRMLHQQMEVMALHALAMSGGGQTWQADTVAGRASRNAADLYDAVAGFALLKEAAYQRSAQQQLRSLRVQSAGVIAISVLMALGLFIVLGVLHRTLAGRIESVSRAARSVGAGDLGASLPQDNITEFMLLAESFNAMAGNLRSARDEIARQTKVLVQSEKMSAMGRMLAGLAHEMNNPLASIVGYTDLMLAEGVADDASLRAVHAEALRARGIMETLVQFARRSAAQIGVVSIGEVTDVIQTLCAYRFAMHNVTITFDVERAVAVRCDAQALEQVLLNLVQSAYDAVAQRGGTISVMIRRAASGVEFSVEDDGPGITDLDRVFEPFQASRAMGAGGGLGLALVHMLVDAMGGHTFASNRPGGGVRVGFHLPPGTLPQAEQVRPAALPHARAVTGARVLIVEDEAPLRELHTRLLQRMGAVPTSVEDGATAIDMLAAHSWDLVVSDVRMPGKVDGFALWNWITRNRPKLCASTLFVSGDIADDVLVRLPGLPAEHLLSKPFRKAHYESTVRAMLAGREPDSTCRPDDGGV